MNIFNNFNLNPFEHFNLSQWIGNMLKELLQNSMLLSKDVWIIAGIIGAILFIFGWKKCKNVPLISYGIYLIIQIVGGVLLG